MDNTANTDQSKKEANTLLFLFFICVIHVIRGYGLSSLGAFGVLAVLFVFIRPPVVRTADTAQPYARPSRWSLAAR